MFAIPLGNASKAFVSELPRLFKAYAERTILEVIALTVAMVISSLLLQKPHCFSKTHDHTACLERRLQLWKAGDIISLILKGRTIHRRLPQHSSPPHNNQNLSRNFSKLMLSGKTKATLRLLSDQDKYRVLYLNDSINKWFEMFLSPNIQQISLLCLNPSSKIMSPLQSTREY